MTASPVPKTDDVATVLPVPTAPDAMKKDEASTPAPVASEKTSAIN